MSARLQVLAAALLLALASAALAQESTPPDSAAAGAPVDSVARFLDSLADSTDDFFGASVAPVDSAGLDSALVYNLANPRRRPPLELRFKLVPGFDFNRVDGPVYELGAHAGRARDYGMLRGQLCWAAGPNEWLGEGRYEKARVRSASTWRFEAGGGRKTASMDREHGEHRLAAIRALVSGSDRQHYLRRDGWDAELVREATTWSAGVQYRDQLESSLVTTATWNLRDAEPAIIDNLPAFPGRVHEVGVTAAWSVPRVPVRLEGSHFTSGDAIGSDLEYRRTRVALAGNFGLGRFAAVVPQAMYGRLAGTPVPQESFYLGGSHTLRSLHTNSFGGTGLALARLDVVGTQDVLALAHIPHPAAFPLQLGVFGAVGAVWGVDPFGGPTVQGVDWPERETWRSEVGAAIVYQPGIPDPTMLIRLNYAQPIGPGKLDGRWSITYTRALDLVRPFER